MVNKTFGPSSQEVRQIPFHQHGAGKARGSTIRLRKAHPALGQRVPGLRKRRPGEGWLRTETAPWLTFSSSPRNLFYEPLLGAGGAVTFPVACAVSLVASGTRLKSAPGDRGWGKAAPDSATEVKVSVLHPGSTHQPNVHK